MDARLSPNDDPKGNNFLSIVGCVVGVPAVVIVVELPDKTLMVVDIFGVEEVTCVVVVVGTVVVLLVVVVVGTVVVVWVVAVVGTVVVL